MSVLPELQREGIGAKLMRETLRTLRDHGAAGCVLVGDPAYYERFGFRAEPQLVYPGAPAKYCLALSFGGAVPTGTLSYHPAFEATE